MIVLVHADAHVAVLDVCGSADGGIKALTAQGRCCCTPCPPISSSWPSMPVASLTRTCTAHTRAYLRISVGGIFLCLPVKYHPLSNGEAARQHLQQYALMAQPALMMSRAQPRRVCFCCRLLHDVTPWHTAPLQVWVTQVLQMTATCMIVALSCPRT